MKNDNDTNIVRNGNKFNEETTGNIPSNPSAMLQDSYIIDLSPDHREPLNYREVMGLDNDDIYELNSAYDGNIGVSIRKLHGLDEEEPKRLVKKPSNSKGNK